MEERAHHDWANELPQEIKDHKKRRAAEFPRQLAPCLQEDCQATIQRIDRPEAIILRLEKDNTALIKEKVQLHKDLAVTRAKYIKTKTNLTQERAPHGDYKQVCESLIADLNIRKRRLEETHKKLKQELYAFYEISKSHQ